MEQGQEDVAVQDQADNDNWREWERVADELTWQRLLGLDGSLLFLEHVFWVISLNTLFTVLFGMCFMFFLLLLLCWNAYLNYQKDKRTRNWCVCNIVFIYVLHFL